MSSEGIMVLGEKLDETTIHAPTPASLTESPAVATYCVPFDAVKASLSTHPLRRPIRNKPLDENAEWTKHSEQELDDWMKKNPF